MLLSDKISKLGIDFKAENEQEVETLALLVQDPGINFAGFLDDEKYIDAVPERVKMLIVDSETAEKICLRDDLGLLIVDNPRLVFFKLHNAMVGDEDYDRNRYNTVIGKNCNISNFVVIAKENVTIGDNVTIEEFVSIKENTVIGDNCIIRTGSCIGMDGFEFKRDGEEVFGVKHLGGVILGKDVEIQGGVYVNKAVYPWDNTVIGDYSKLDDLIHVGHGAKIGKGVMAVTHSTLCGRTQIDDNVWVGIGAYIRNTIHVGENARVNMGAVVTKDVPPGEAVTGNFAIPHGDFMEELKSKRKK